MQTKVCSVCKLEKTADEFNKHSKTKDGLDSWCKNCRKEKKIFWHKKSREKNKITALLLSVKEKKCFKCGKTKPSDKFSKSQDSKDGFSGKCKECDSKEARVEKDNNRVRNRDRDYNKSEMIYCCSCKQKKLNILFAKNKCRFNGYNAICKMCCKIMHRRIRYGLDPDAVEVLINKQNKNCALCQRPLGLRFHIDHNHTSNSVRGILCHRCNIGLGMFDDNPGLLRNAVAYLEKEASHVS